MASFAPAMGDNAAYTTGKSFNSTSINAVNAPYSTIEQQELNRETQRQSRDLSQLQKMDVLNAASCSNAGTTKAASAITPQRRIKAKRKNDSLLETLCAAIVKHQLGR